jgi:AcrR family transcriptional regulator
MDTDARREQLLALGLGMFAARTYDAVSIDDVALAAGISKGLLYHYFPTKRDFYVAVVCEAARRLLEVTDPPRDLLPLERLVAGLQGYLTFVDAHALTYAALLRGGIGTDEDVIRVVEGARATIIERLLEGLGQAAPDALLRLLLRGWIGFVEATSLDWIQHRDLERDALLQLWVQQLVRTLPREAVKA